jgi:hypothetical protein
MFRIISRLAGNARRRRRGSRATRPACDALEGRQLLSVSRAVTPPGTPASPWIAVQAPFHPPNPCFAGTQAQPLLLEPVHPVTGAWLHPPVPT